MYLVFGNVEFVEGMAVDKVVLHGVVEHGFEIAEVYAASIGRGGGILQEFVEVLQPLQCHIVGLKRSGILFKFGIQLDNTLSRCLVLFAS